MVTENEWIYKQVTAYEGRTFCHCTLTIHLLLRCYWSIPLEIQMGTRILLITTSCPFAYRLPTVYREYLGLWIGFQEKHVLLFQMLLFLCPHITLKNIGSAISKDISLFSLLLKERGERKIPSGDFSEDTRVHPMWESINRQTLIGNLWVIGYCRRSASLHSTAGLTNYKQRQKEKTCRCRKIFLSLFIIETVIGYVLSEGFRSQMASSFPYFNMHLGTIKDTNK